MKDPNKLLAFLMDTGLLGMVTVLSYILATIFGLNYFFPDHLDLIIIGTVIVQGQTFLREFDQVLTSWLMRKRRPDFYDIDHSPGSPSDLFQKGELTEEE